MLAEFLVVLEGFKSSSERGDLLSRARLRLADPSRLDKDIGPQLRPAAQPLIRVIVAVTVTVTISEPCQRLPSAHGAASVAAIAGIRSWGTLYSEQTCVGVVCQFLCTILISDLCRMTTFVKACFLLLAVGSVHSFTGTTMTMSLRSSNVPKGPATARNVVMEPLLKPLSAALAASLIFSGPIIPNAMAANVANPYAKVSLSQNHS